MSAVNVHINFGGEDIYVGELYLSEDAVRYVFSYDPLFVSRGLQISPLHMSTEKKTHYAKNNDALYYIHSVFADSLPDKWGRKVQDAQFESIGVVEPNPLERLAFIGRHGIGALAYHPAKSFPKGAEITDLAEIRKATQRIIEGDVENVSSRLLRCGGSAGGARPKFLVDIKENNHEKIRYSQGRYTGGYIPVVLKVPEKGDRYQKIEYIYSQFAQSAGLDIPKTYLIRGKGSEFAFFAIERFDVRPDGGRYHVHTLAGILNMDFTDKTPGAANFLQTIGDVTRDHRQVVEGYRRVAFNYIGSNPDDHGKNFSFIMDGEGRWSLAPAYDIGYSKTYEDQHQMAIGNKRRNAQAIDFKKLAEAFGIQGWESIIVKIMTEFEKWPKIAKEYEVPAKNITEIGNKIRDNIRRIEKGLYRGG